jgi:hypothetical protein
VAGSIDRRIEALEGVYSREPCEECGWTGSWSVGEFEVLWGDRPDEGPSEPEWCGTCGRQTVIIVTWADIPEDAGDRIRRAERGK